MPTCEFCGEEFETKQAMHAHWEDHRDELTAHQKDTMKRARRAREKRAEQSQSMTSSRKHVIGYALIAVLVLALLGVVGSQLVTFNTDATPGTVDADPAALADQPMLGNASAPVTVVEFYDYRCPYCQQFDQSIMPTLIEDYVETGKVQLYAVNYAFLGTGSTQAAVAAECVYNEDPDGFWDFHHALYDNQGPESQRWVTTDLLVDLAEQHTAANPDTVRSCIQNQDTRQQVMADQSLGQEYGVQGTPAVYVDGVLIRNWQGGGLFSAIDQRLN